MIAALLLPTMGLAQTTREKDRDGFQVFIGGSAGVFGGSRLVGKGSRERYQSGAITLIDARVSRFFKHSPFGLEIALALTPPAFGSGREIAFGRLELLTQGVALEWRGAVPGRIVVGVGGGGDVGRYWWEGRGYPLVVVKERMWLSRKVRLDLRSETIPIAATPHLPLFEQRFELAMGVHLLALGVRFIYTSAMGGQPFRSYEQHELDAFVGIGL